MKRLIRDYCIALLVLILALAGVGHHAAVAAGPEVTVICGAGGHVAFPVQSGGPATPTCPDCLPGVLADALPPPLGRGDALAPVEYRGMAVPALPASSPPYVAIRAPPPIAPS